MSTLTCPTCGHCFLPPDAAYRVGRMVVDTLWREIRVDGLRRETRRREFDFVAALAQEAGAVLSYDQIVDLMDVWEVSPKPYCGLQAWRVREKLGDAVNIHSHRHVGYSIHPRNKAEGAVV